MHKVLKYFSLVGNVLEGLVFTVVPIYMGYRIWDKQLVSHTVPMLVALLLFMMAFFIVILFLVWHAEKQIGEMIALFKARKISP